MKLFKYLTIISALTGIIIAALDDTGGFMTSNSLFLYFTIQSNLWMIGISIIGLIYIYSKKPFFGSYYLVKYSLTIGILITYIVFTFLLSPFLTIDYLLSLPNIMLHTLTPLFSLLDFMTSDKLIERKSIFLGYITPVYYLGFVYLMYFLEVKFNGKLFPYFFLDFVNNSWFSINKNQIGLIYWWIVIVIFVLLISYSLYRVKRIKHKYINYFITLFFVIITIVFTLSKVL